MRGDIRDLVAGILEDEGFVTRTARDSDFALAGNLQPAAASGVPRHLVAGLASSTGCSCWSRSSAISCRSSGLMISGTAYRKPRSPPSSVAPYDFIEKPFKSDRLNLVATRALETAPEARGEGAQAARAGARRPDRSLGLA